ncbi:MAG: hypothetical protein NT133_26130, partial [Alphaproteobacteria bacterium]|nr:hypothetical protein [Alphaproteobacteria bacterium]
DHNNDQNRSTNLHQWSELLKFPAHWVALQKDVRAADLPDLLARPEIAHYPDEMRDFADTAALIDQLALVIAADTSVAHLAGGLGKPVWILVPANSDWRWLVDRTDTPWYRSARLFRQDRVSNWDRTFDQLQAALQAEFTLPA